MRAMLVGGMAASAVGGGDTKELIKIWKMLTGTYEPPAGRNESDPAAAKKYVRGIFGI